MEQEYLSVKEVAARFKVPLRQVKLAVKDGTLKAARVGRAVTVSASSAADWIQRKEATS